MVTTSMVFADEAVNSSQTKVKKAPLYRKAPSDKELDVVETAAVGHVCSSSD